MLTPADIALINFQPGNNGYELYGTSSTYDGLYGLAKGNLTLGSWVKDGP
jgi:hypothetical protein